MTEKRHTGTPKKENLEHDLSETVTLKSDGSVSDELDVESGVITRYTRKVVDLSTLSWTTDNE